MDLNRVTIMGRLAADVNLWTSKHGARVAKFTLALNREYKDKATGKPIKKVTWIPVSVWGARALPCSEYLKKGSLVFVDGYLETGSYVDKDGVKRYSTHVTAQNVKFLSPKPSKLTMPKE